MCDATRVEDRTGEGVARLAARFQLPRRPWAAFPRVPVTATHSIAWPKRLERCVDGAITMIIQHYKVRLIFSVPPLDPGGNLVANQVWCSLRYMALVRGTDKII